MKSNKKNIINYYNSSALNYDLFTKNYGKKYLQLEYYLFLTNITGGKKILDIGCGPCRDSEYFINKGFTVIPIDLSEEMIKICGKKNIYAYKMDMENLKFVDGSFNGIWAYTSLLHLPKNKINNMLKKIYNLLEEKGVFFIGMRKGNFDGEKNNIHFSEYEIEEIKKLLKKYFKIKFLSVVAPRKSYHYINVLCIKN